MRLRDGLRALVGAAISNAPDSTLPRALARRIASRRSLPPRAAAFSCGWGAVWTVAQEMVGFDARSSPITTAGRPRIGPKNQGDMDDRLMTE